LNSKSVGKQSNVGKISKITSFASNFKNTRDSEQSTIAGMNLTDVNKKKNQYSSSSDLSSSSSLVSTQNDLYSLPEFGDGCMDINSSDGGEKVVKLNLKEFLKLIDLEQFKNLFENEHVTLEILSEMSHKELKDLGIEAYGHRHKIIKGIEKYFKKCILSPV
jgi:hypothetical protein